MEPIARSVVAAIARVEVTDARGRGVNDRGIFGARFRFGIRKVAQEREMNLLFAVGEELHFERGERIAHDVDAREERRNHDRRPELRGNP